MDKMDPRAQAIAQLIEFLMKGEAESAMPQPEPQAAPPVEEEMSPEELEAMQSQMG